MVKHKNIIYLMVNPLKIDFKPRLKALEWVEQEPF